LYGLNQRKNAWRTIKRIQHDTVNWIKICCKNTTQTRAAVTSDYNALAEKLDRSGIKIATILSSSQRVPAVAVPSWGVLAPRHPLRSLPRPKGEPRNIFRNHLERLLCNPATLLKAYAYGRCTFLGQTTKDPSWIYAQYPEQYGLRLTRWLHTPFPKTKLGQEEAYKFGSLLIR